MDDECRCLINCWWFKAGLGLGSLGIKTLNRYIWHLDQKNCLDGIE